MTTCSGITARPLDVTQVSLEAARQVVPDSLYWYATKMTGPAIFAFTFNVEGHSKTTHIFVNATKILVQSLATRRSFKL